MYDVHLQHHVLIHEVGQCCLVGNDTSYLGGGEEYIFGALLLEELLHLLLATEVKLGGSACDDIGIALALKFAYDSRTHHATVSSDINLAVSLHCLIVNYDTLYQDSLLAWQSNNKFYSTLATLRNCEL